MSTTISVRTDEETKRQAEELFNELGLNMSTAINMFMKQALRERRIPFTVGRPYPNATTITAIEEGRRLAQNPSAPRITSIEEFKTLIDDL